MIVMKLRVFVEIKQKSDDIYIVTVSDKFTTSHNVEVTENMLNDLTDNRITKYSLIEFSFNYLLDRESNTSILSFFNIEVISRYFAEYLEEVKRWCDEYSI